MSTPGTTPATSPRGNLSREGSGMVRTPRQKSDLSRTGTPTSRQNSDLSRTSPGGESLSSLPTPATGSKLPGRSRLPLPGAGRQPSFTNISRKSQDKEGMATPKQEKQAFQRERSFVETNFVQTPKTTNVTQILPPATGEIFDLKVFDKPMIIWSVQDL